MFNLLNIWVLARLLLTLCTVLLNGVGLAVADKLVRSWRPDESGAHQLALERRAELAAKAVELAGLLSMAGLLFTVVLADRLAGSIRGAMCAFGVLASTDSGFWALLASAAAAVGSGLWLVLHRLDLRLQRPVLTRKKFLWLLLLGPLVWLDAALTLAFVRQLDLSVIASCCSVWLDDTVATSRAALFERDPGQAALLGSVAVFAAAASSAVVWRRPGRWTALLAGALSAAAPLAMTPAVCLVVATHALGTPHHPCPFCLLRSQAYGLGWPLYIAAFVGLVFGLGLAVVQAHRRVAGQPQQVDDLLRRLGLWSAAGWIGALVFGALPVLSYLVMSGGVPVHGEVQ